jgi:hypothetical protein
MEAERQAVEELEMVGGGRGAIVLTFQGGAVDGGGRRGLLVRQMLVRGETERAPDVLAGFVFLFVLNYFGEEAAFEAMDNAKNR